MIGLIFAAAALQAQAANDCDAAAAPYPPAAGCPQWRLIRRQAEADGYQDPNSVTRSGDSFEITIRVVYATEIGNGARSMVMRSRYNCARRTWVILHLRVHDVAGRTLVDSPVPDDPPTSPLADSPGADILNEYCPRPAPTS